MKKILIVAAAVMMAASCEKDPANLGLSTQDKELKAAVEQYVPGVIYKIYGNLADEAQNLYADLLAMKTSASISQTQIDKACTDFLAARKWWEQSEAFLFGAATAYGIDPHIDSWPLDQDKLAKSLSNADVIDDLDKEGAGAVDEVGAASLGFHGIEYILFRDGKNRKSIERNEIIFAAAVAEDLRNYCSQLHAAWDPGCPSARVQLVEDLELNTVMDSGLTYGENLLQTGNAGSTYRNWPEAVASILVAGCSNICNEVANTKIGTAHYVNGDEYNPDYIESPYSKKSYEDFKDNILSIQYSLYGAQGAEKAGKASIVAFLKSNKWSRADELTSALSAAVKSLDDAKAKGAFVDNPTSAEAENCIVKINALDALLNEAADWISKL